MRTLLSKIIFLLNFIYTDSYGQNFTTNSCDSTTLTKLEFEKCKGDTAWAAEIIINTSYITHLKTDLLPKYRTIRKGLTLSDKLQNSLRLLKLTYDTVLNSKESTFLYEMDMNQKFVQPKAYLASLLSLQTFRFYPDIYAILLNDVHLKLTPKTTLQELNKYTKMVDNIFKNIPSELYQQLETITTAFTNENDKLMKQGFSPMFQGMTNLAEKKKYRIINFLLWTN